MKAAVMGVVQAHFRPEFINRLDEIVVFRPLDKTQIRQIARIQTDYLAKRLAERQLELTLSDKALDLLGNVGFDPVYGARPLKRAIQQQLENPLAQGNPRREVPAGRYGRGRCARRAPGVRESLIALARWKETRKARRSAGLLLCAD